MVESFWAIPDVAALRTPLSILREQASALTEQTKGLLVGVVETRALRSEYIEITLEILVPALNDFRYRILSYVQPVEMYPGTPDGNSIYKVNDEGEFIEWVREKLSSDRVKNALTSLLAQVREPQPSKRQQQPELTP